VRSVTCHEHASVASIIRLQQAPRIGRRKIRKEHNARMWTWL
jgi:hypothetical protein